jgi:hypothetical protein
MKMHPFGGAAVALSLWFSTLVSGLAAAAASPGTIQQDSLFTQEDRHQHGAASLSIALDGGSLSIRLEAPAIDLLGFEHAPENATETRKVQEIQRLLAAGRGVSQLPADAGCTLKREKVTTPPWAIAGTNPASASTPTKPDEHDHDHDHDEHGDYDAEYEYACTAPGKLAYVDILLRQHLPAATRLRIYLVTASQQTVRELARGQSRIALR